MSTEKTELPYVEKLAREIRIAVAWFFVVLFALSVWRGLGYYGRDPTDPDEGPSSGLTVHTDAATGCEYLSVGGSALVPRYATDGGQMGCR